MDFIKIDKEHTFVYKMNNDKVILNMNNHLKNYFNNRGLILMEQIKTKNYIFTYDELYKKGEYNRNLNKNTDVITSCIIKNIPMFHRNRLRYMSKNDVFFEEVWYANIKKYDQYALQHISELLLINNIRHIMFTWNLDCLHYLPTDTTFGKGNKNIPLLYSYNEITKSWEETKYG